MTQKQTNTALVFIGGAGLNPSLWKELTKGISAPYVLVDVSASRSDDSSLAGYVECVEHQIAGLGDKKIIVVAHSIGGVIGIELLKRLGDRAAGFIGVSAAIPAPGKSFTSIFPFPQNVAMPLILRMAGTRPPRSAIISGLCSDLDAEAAGKIADEFKPESLHLYLDKTTATPIPEVPALYIRTTDDKEFTAQQQEAMAKQLPNVEIADFDCGHLPMLTKQDGLLAACNAFLARV